MLKCRNCNFKVKKFMSFGRMPIANAFVKNPKMKEYYFELAPGYCPKCSLFQLITQPNPKKLFHENYAFFAGTSSKMQKHFKDLANKLIKKFKIKKNDLTVEIGNNDGGVVNYLAKKKYKNLGVDPSLNVAKSAKSKGVNMYNGFFDYSSSMAIKKKYGLAKVFIAQNTLAHIPNINSVFKGVENLLTSDGIMITEDPYLPVMLKKGSYDQIYDEHVFILSLTAMINICEKYNLKVFDVELLKTAGGSLRYYICRNNSKPTSNKVKKQIKLEKKLNLKSYKTYQKFKKKCEQSKKSLLSILKSLKKKKKTIVGYGATSKSTTIFNYCGINSKLIDYITDTTPTKINKYTPGTLIPVKDHKYFEKNYPDYCLLLAWNHQEEIFLKEKKRFSKKGKWIIHLPKLKIIKK